jgi:hypothetical protein
VEAVDGVRLTNVLQLHDGSVLRVLREQVEAHVDLPHRRVKTELLLHARERQR